MTNRADFSTDSYANAGSAGGGNAERFDRLVRMIESLAGLPDAATAGSAACALLAAEFADSGVCVVARPVPPLTGAETVLADYPYGIGLADMPGGESINIPVDLGNVTAGRSVSAALLAWRSPGDRRFTAAETELLTAIGPHLRTLVVRLLDVAGGGKRNALDPETGLWPLPSFLAQADRRFDRLDIEERVGTMFAIGWVKSGGATGSEASSAVIRESAETLRDMLRPSDLIGRIGPTRLAAWCDGVDHLIAAERGDRIVARLDAMLAGTGRHAAIGIASRWARSGDDPATVLANARAGLEQARLTSAATGRPVVRIWQSEIS
ncbi:diguanylate cyclase [Acidiphilium multivorum]|uniref:diguanylate cyclase domain-containing protein n=1 Tax=Acidiphilium multivorum TaxID=62140 RepID=UPI001F4C28FF|nr:diguanylate cyclase [Acidiphilium multivorum]UNC15218.1 diguanylate cyclase [Acidiphilium multivorum]